jgi:hypothetical protein
MVSVDTGDTATSEPRLQLDNRSWTWVVRLVGMEGATSDSHFRIPDLQTARNLGLRVGG